MFFNLISADVLKEKGNELFRAKKYQEAIEYYKKAISINDRNDILYSNKGTCEKCLQNYRQAIVDYKKALLLDPKNAKNYHRLASVYLIKGELYDAFSMQKQALEIEPYNSTYQDQLETINKMIDEKEKIKSIEKQKNFDELKKKYQELIEKYPEFIYLKLDYILAMIMHLKFKEAKEFIANQFATDKVNKNNLEFGFLIGLILYYDGDYKGAEKIISLIKNSDGISADKCEQLLYKIRNIDSIKLKANELYSQKKYEEAIKAYTKALEFDPLNRKFNAVILVNRALCYEKINKYYEAIKDATLSIEINPNYARGYIKRANVYLKLNNYKNALEDFEKAKKIDPSSPGIENYVKNISSQVTDLERNLKTQKDVNQKLYNEIISLKNLINVKDNIIKEKNKQINELENKKSEEIQNLIDDIMANKAYSYNNKINNSTKDKIIELMQKLEEKEEMLKKKEFEIKELKLKYPFELLNDEKMLIVKIESQAKNIDHSFLCKNTHKFSYLENLLYELYPSLTDSENYFIANGNKVNKYKTIEENNIKDNDIVILYGMDDDEESSSFHPFVSKDSISSINSISLGDSNLKESLKESNNGISENDSKFCGFQFDCKIKPDS